MAVAADQPHEFVGRHDRWCEVCNRPDRDPIHETVVDRPHVIVRTRDFNTTSGGEVTGPLVAVYVDGRQWRVAGVGVQYQPDGLAEITLRFYGSFETLPLARSA